MSDSANETVDADRLLDSDPRAMQDAAPFLPAGCKLKPGETWHDFLIEEPWTAGAANAFVASDKRTMKKVLIRAFPIVASTEWRRGAWDRLCALQESQIVRCISAEEEEGWRYEISAEPPPMNLQEWLACHRPTSDEVGSLVRQLAATLGTLHAQGVVHLGINPSAIFIDESTAEPLFLLGGFQEATLYTQPLVMPSKVDPLYAPPEAVGVASLPAGTRLCAWDWWSTGRVVQEFVIGRHVLALVLDRDVSRVTPELRAKAEALLLEREPAGARAGALEYMTVEPTLMPLLRGLLTGSCEARWGFDAVQRWLRREPVLDHYDLPRNARFWVLKGQGFTLAEAANHFTRAEHWDEGEDMLFQPEQPETLAAFLADSPAHREDWNRLQAVCDLSEKPAWSEVPVVARRTVAAALAWLALANGSGVRTVLRIRGQTIDSLGLGELLRAAGPGPGVALLTALLTPVVIEFVESFDASAARVLKLIASKGGEAVLHGAQHGWLDPHDQDARARIFELALKAGALLRDAIELLRSLYATNSNATLAALLTEKNLSPRDCVILAFTAEAPERYGYITHEQWRKQRCAALKAEANEIVTAFFWKRLHWMLSLTRIWGAPTPYFAGAVLVVTATVAWASRAAGPATLVAAILLLSRAYFWWRTRAMVRKFDPAASGWAWSDGIARSLKEANQPQARRKPLSPVLSGELERLRGEIAALFKVKSEAPVIAVPRWWDLWCVFGASVILTLGVLVFVFAQRLPAGPHSEVAGTTTEAMAVASGSDIAPSTPTPVTLWGVDPAVDIDELVATGRYEVIDDGFGRQLRGPLQAWTFYAGEEIRPLEIVARAPASADQAAFALVSGSLLMQPYSRKGVSVLLAVRVPTSRGFGFLIFNTRDRKLLDEEVRLVRAPLKDHTWYQLDSRRIAFLGTPAALESEISLAPP